MDETRLAQKFVNYFSCYDLYFEVDYYRCIDIVAINGNVSMAIEVKRNFNFNVLDQAIQNQPYFNLSFIAVPEFIKSRIQETICRDYGIGLLVFRYKNGREYVEQWMKPKLNRHPINHGNLKSRLHDYNKQSIPGSRSGDGGKITAFGVTVEKIITYVKRNPGKSIKEVIESVTHHYTNDQAAISAANKYIRIGVIKELEILDRKVYLKPQNGR